MLKSKNEKVSLIVMLQTLILSIFSGFVPIVAEAATLTWRAPLGDVAIRMTNPNSSTPSNDVTKQNLLYIDGEVAFCIEPRVFITTGTGYSSGVVGEDFQNIENGRVIGSTPVKTIELVTYYGYYTQPNSVNQYYTQALIWDLMGEEVHSMSGTGISTAGFNAFKSAVMEKVENYKKSTLFDTPTVNLKPGESVVLTDRNGIIDDLDVALNSANVNIVKNNNNTITVTATNESVDGLLYFVNTSMNNYKGTSIAYKHSSSQDVGVIKIKDPQSGYLRVTMSKNGQLKIIKRDADGALVEGVRFALSLSEDFDNAIEVETDEFGEVTQDDLVAGTYYVKEISVPNHLVLNTEVKQVTVTPETTATVEFVNEFTEGQAKIIKTDDAQNRVAGAVFEISDSRNFDTILDTLTTTQDGTIMSKDLRLGTYYVREKSAPAHLVKSDEIKEFNLTRAGQVAEVTYVNEVVKTQLKVVKKDVEGQVVSNVVFEVSNTPTFDTILEELTTGPDGTAVSQELPMGTYYVREKSVPNHLVLNTTSKPVLLNTPGEMKTVEFVNEFAKASAKLIKKSDKDELVADTTFEVSRNREFTQIVATVTTNNQGEVTTQPLKLGTYYVRETATARHLVLSTEIKEIVLDTPDETKELEWINEYAKGQMRIVKRDADNGTVANVTFEISANQNFETILHTVTTNETGVAEIPNLELGTYYIREKSVPTHLVLNPEVKTAVVTGDNQVIEVEYINQFATARAKIIKKDADDMFVPGVTFEISTTREFNNIVDTLVTKENGTAESKDLRLGTYFVRETKVPSHLTINEEIKEFKLVNNGQVLEIEYINQFAEGSIKVVKADAETQQPLSGVQFEVVKDNQVVETITTGDDGTATTGNLRLGDYILREVQTLETYRLNNQEYPVTISSTQRLVTVNATNVVKKLTISIAKTLDKDLNSNAESVPGKGITFKVISDKTKEVVATIVTDDKGEAKTGELRADDTYTIEEVAPTGYTPAQPIKLVPTTEDNKNYHYTVENNVLKSFLKIVKVDEETGETIPVAGTKFQIFDANNNVVTQTIQIPEVKTIDTFETDENGIVTLPEQLKYGNYTIKEVKAPTGYVLSEEALPVTINGNETTVSVKFSNAPQKGIIEITKRGKAITEWKQNEEGIFEPVLEDKNLGNAVFEIRNDKNEVVDTVTTVEFGIGTSKELPLGDYKVVETVAPEGYLITNKETSVSLTPQEQTVRLDIEAISVYNERKTLTVEVNKVFEQSELFKNEQIATIGLYNLEDYTENNVVLPKDSMIAKATIENNGTLTFKDIPSGMKVYAKEISSSKAYSVNEDKFVVETETTEGKVNVVTIENKLQRGNYKVVKVDSDSQTLEGVTFQLVAVTDNDNEVELGTYTTDATGSIKFENLEYGNYYYKEVSPLKGYILDENKYTFTISGGETGEGESSNIVVNERLPEVLTDATNYEDNTKVVYSHQQIREVAHLSKLDIGKTYVVKTHQNIKEDKKERVSEQTKTIVATAHEMDVEFIYDVTVEMLERHVVFGEEVYDEKGNLLSSNFDWENERETVYVTNPKINTLAKVGNKKFVYTANGKQEITDDLKYSEFKAGEVIVRSWAVKYGTTEPLVVDGKNVEVEQKLSLNESGVVTVSLGHIDFTNVAPGKYTLMEQAFEVVADKEGNKVKGKMISNHEDPSSESQSFIVRKPKINTLAKVRNKKFVYTANGTQELTDDLTYSDFEKGEVIVRSWAVKYGTTEPLVVDGKNVEVEQKLSLNESGEVTVSLGKIDFSKVEPDKYTLMEQVFEVVADKDGNKVKGKMISNHEDPNSESQSFVVRKPKINTLAKIGNKKIIQTNSGKLELTDELDYSDFENGEVIVRSWLVRYGTDEMIVIDNKRVEVEQLLSLDENGKVVVSLGDIDTSKLPEGKYTMMEQVFEVVTDKDGNKVKGDLISSHEDNKDEAQSFVVNARELPETGLNSSINYIMIGLFVTISSVVSVVVIQRRRKNNK